MLLVEMLIHCAMQKELANTLVWLCLDEDSFAMGTHFTVDGGMIAT